MENQDELNSFISRYGSTTNEEIQELLKRITLVRLTNKGLGSRIGYYTFNAKVLKKIKENPRCIIEIDPPPSKYQEQLTRSKNQETLVFLSRYHDSVFIQVNVGEVFDQMNKDQKEKTIAIAIKQLAIDVIKVQNQDKHYFLVEAKLFY